MPLTTGTRIGSYEVTSLLGKGGMGEVYRAKDTKLGRDVAIKTLPAAFATSPERLMRFEREAKVLAKLSHSNIATVYALEDYDEGKALVMELVEGSTINGPLAIEQVAKLAAQVADALEAAHDKGITHRDIKPGNIMVTPQGTVKVLDFGLATVPQAEPEASIDGATAITLTFSPTQAGMILGTAPYMSPEQAAGQPVDRHADIWSFGVLLWELLTGSRLFTGDTVAHVLADVLRMPIDFSKLPAETPKAFRELLARCLERDVRKRLHAIGEARLILEKWLADPRSGESAGATDVPPYAKARATWVPWIVAGALALGLGAPAFLHFREKPEEKPLVRLDVDLGADVSFLPLNSNLTPLGSSIAISPDGMRLAYVSGAGKLFTRRLDQPKATELTGATGVAPFFSADSHWIGFETSGKLSKISVEGGAVVPLADLGSFFPGSWSEDGYIWVGGPKGLLRVRDGGGAPETVIAPANGEVRVVFPQLLPGGKAVLFSAYTATRPDASSIEVLTLADHHRKTVSRAGTSPRYVATSSGAGYLLYLNKATLFAVPFDLDKLETRGTALPVVDDVAVDSFFGTAQLSISRNGTLVYRKSAGDSGFTVALLDGAGKTQPLPAKPGAYGRPALSPDGQRLAVEVNESSGTDLWVYDMRRDTMTRLTFSGNNFGPLWSPDGRYIAFRTLGAGTSVTRSDGAGKPQPLTQSKNAQYPWSFTADGKRLAINEQDPKNSWDLWTVPIESDATGMRAGKPEPFLQTSADERAPALSPDGRWLAYASNESGTSQIYVRAFPDEGGKWQISNGGGFYPMWAHAGHDLFFETSDNHIMVASYTVKGDSFEADKPRMWTGQEIGGLVNTSKNFDLTPDGKRIVALMPAAESKGAQEGRHQVVFLENFLDELRRKVPVAK